MTKDPRLEPFEIQGHRFEPIGEQGYMPVPPVGLFGLSSDEPMEVVGESRYQDGIRRIVNAWRTDPEADDGDLLAFLFAEPGNPFDRNAVRVLLIFDDDHATCGYLPKEQAYNFSRAVRQAADEGLIVALNARAFGGTPDKPSIGIWLGLPADAYAPDGSYPSR